MKIAIIEDDTMIAEMYRMKLEAEGFTALVADTGMNGIALVRDKRPDLILLDYTLPDVDGAAVLREVRRQPDLAEIPVIVLTNMDDRMVAEKLAQWKIIDYIVKASLTPREVVDKIRQALNIKDNKGE